MLQYLSTSRSSRATAQRCNLSRAAGGPSTAVLGCWAPGRGSAQKHSGATAERRARPHRNTLLLVSAPRRLPSEWGIAERRAPEISLCVVPHIRGKGNLSYEHFGLGPGLGYTLTKEKRTSSRSHSDRQWYSAALFAWEFGSSSQANCVALGPCAWRDAVTGAVEPWLASGARRGP